MSKINAVRLINVNYNNNSIRISDECLHFNGESTLISLRNGGGKSVLVQMMTAPFVHKRYRDAKDRPFESYFTTNKPSFILVEWVLDQGAGYVLTGLMVRRAQDMQEGSTENLDMIGIVSEYQGPCLQDIHHLPVVEKGKKEIILKNYNACKQLFETFKKDRTMKFFYYDMTNSAQSRQYFDKLMEYQINYKEWETIIKKINLKESGLSELFSDCKDEKGLVEKWFLDAVENKLNKDQNRIREFQSILEKYAGQYKDNRSKIRRRDHIRAFKEQAEGVGERAEKYQSAKEEERIQENKIAWFIHDLNTLHEETLKQHGKVLEHIEELEQKVERVQYEELSSQVYECEDQKDFHTGNRDMIDMERENLTFQAEKVENRLHLLSCAKQQAAVQEEQEDLDILRQKITLARKQGQDLEPERKALGFSLKCHYENQLKENETRQNDTETKRDKVLEDAAAEAEKIDQLEQKIREIISRKGSLNSLVKGYDKEEERFNLRYHEELARSILGTYEPGTLEIRQQIYDRELENTVRNRASAQKELEELRERQKSLERALEDKKEELVHKDVEIQKQQEQYEVYESELEARRAVLKYLDLEEPYLFDRDKILHVSRRKLEEIAGIRRNLEKEEDETQKEYQRLKSGRVLELPGELEEELKNLDIQIVYGMEWLKKNGYTQKQNQELVRRHPFLPYALIMTRQEMEKFAGNAGNICTSFPVPIIEREKIEQVDQKCKDGIVHLDGISFYILFNENLLDEEMLQQMIWEKQQQLGRIREAVDLRQKEYTETFKRQEMVENQSVTREKWDNIKTIQAQLADEKRDMEEEIRNRSQELSQLKKSIENLQNQIFKLSREVEKQNQKKEDFNNLKNSYADYEANREELEKCKKEENKCKDQQKLSRDRREKLLEKKTTLELQLDMMSRENDRLKEKYHRYETYEKPEEVPENLEMSPEQMEIRYEAITATFSQELQELESQEQKCAKRFHKAVDELKHLQQKYHLKENLWKDMVYDRKEENHQEAVLEDFRRKIETKNMLWNEEDKQIAVYQSRISELLGRIHSMCRQDAPVPRGDIVSQDFESRRNQLIFQIKEEKKQEDGLKKRLQSYDENLTALSEYNEIPLGEKVEWEQDFIDMNSQSLRNFKGILIRDYNQRIHDSQADKEELAQFLNQVVRMEIFQDDFYRKPLEKMLELCNDPYRVLMQLQTTVQSYDSLMEKLEVDISLVEKEKERIVELMEDYVLEIHRNLGKIDHNSTIVIRDKPVKMLKIDLPDWDENASLYHIRLEDYVDEVTLKGVEIFEKNENAQEYFGTRITTKTLYDKVVGIGNVQIRLYKIEEQREYPITWAEVARNSGGEGFLSAFVILSSLLYYMRKDDTDIFADRNEGKVLVMDNPFAQTNAAHLLKPLMDMAKKTNTQLICLTGLGGESIYSRFDNIYVLNLIAASLRGGMQYLRAQHRRGEEPDTIIPSRIEVGEQQKLLF